MQATDRRTRGRDLRFAAHLAAVFKLRDEPHIVNRCRIDTTLTRQNLGREADCFDEVACDFRQRSEEEIAEAMATEFARAAKAIAKEAREQSGIFRERDHAVAYVAGRQHLQLFTQPAGTAPIIRNSDDGRKGFKPHAVTIACADKLLESGQQSRKSCPAADSDEVQAVIRFRDWQTFSIPFERSGKVFSKPQVKSYLKGKGFQSYMLGQGGAKQAGRNLEESCLKTGSKDQTLEIRIISEHREVLIVLRAQPQSGLKLQSTL
jgi:hypothetical protein